MHAFSQDNRHAWASSGPCPSKRHRKVGGLESARHASGALKLELARALLPGLASILLIPGLAGMIFARSGWAISRLVLESGSPDRTRLQAS